jgi:DtxR family Mn-dependent transcriptional regulator
MMLTESTEMYLITIYRLTRNDNTYAHTKEIAEGMNVSLPSVSEQLKRLSERGYVNYEWRQGANLTDEGERIALSVLRKHRLIETFLVNMAGYSIDEVHEEACRLEHVVSDRLTDRLDRMLGNPAADPHGHPIPDREGNIPDMPCFPLRGAKAGQTLVIKQVSDWDKDMLSYLNRIGIVPESVITVMEIAPFDGPLTLELGDKTVALSRKVTNDIYVGQIEED